MFLGFSVSMGGEIFAVMGYGSRRLKASNRAHPWHHEKPPYETLCNYLIPTAKDQLGWGATPFEILCKDMLHLAIVPDGTLACVVASEAQWMLEDNSAIMQVRSAVILNVDG